MSESLTNDRTHTCPDYSLLPIEGLRRSIKGLTDGLKYGRNNYTSKDYEFFVDRANHLVEHAIAYAKDVYDKKKNTISDGEDHLAHILANAMILAWREEQFECATGTISEEDFQKEMHAFNKIGIG